ncbi:MAG: DUF86 domain-containing protein [Armatimonadetes bacterium]|nr:DUF86 domain-containing protein [Armatimonadota bacterium]
MKDHRVYLVHILEAIRKIRRYTAEGRDSFFAQEIIQDAVVRNLEIVGEATKRIPPEVRFRYPGIPWKEMAGLRDVLIHHYEGINLARAWNVVERDLAPVEEAISHALPPLDELEREIAGEDQ